MVVYNKYLIKATYTATENHCKKEKGTKTVYYHGKGGTGNKSIKAFNCCDGWFNKSDVEKVAETILSFENMRKNKAYDLEVEVVEY